MYTKELFHETVGILVKAYMNGTLAHGDCNACAVGNIIAYRIGADVIPHQESSIPYFSWVRNGNEITPIWPEIFSGGKIMFGAEKRVDSGWYKRQIDASGIIGEI